MLWHQRLIHLAPSSIQEAHKYVDGVPNLSKFSFDDVNLCETCIKANLRKNSAGKRSLSELVSVPYQGIFATTASPDVYRMIRKAKSSNLVVKISKVSTAKHRGF